MPPKFVSVSAVNRPRTAGRASLSGRPAGLPRNVNRPRPPDVIPAMTIDELAEHGRQWLGGCRVDTLTPADR